LGIGNYAKSTDKESMPHWIVYLTLGIAAWCPLSVVTGLLVGPLLRATAAGGDGESPGSKFL
jgi:hypothetical protein